MCKVEDGEGNNNEGDNNNNNSCIDLLHSRTRSKGMLLLIEED